MPFAVGIDVAGTKRGHHGVALDLGSRRLVECWAWPDEHAALAALAGLEGLMAVAIDAPPAAHRMGVRVREAEVELARKRVRPQWTPAPGGRAQPWMENGERLWQALRRGLPGVAMIETFPTAAVQLGRRPMDVSLPLEFAATRGSIAARTSWTPRSRLGSLHPGSRARPSAPARGRQTERSGIDPLRRRWRGPGRHFVFQLSLGSRTVLGPSPVSQRSACPSCRK